MDASQRISELEKQLAAVTRERDDLHRDVEALCLSRGSHMFSSSYVISEKLVNLEEELKQLRKECKSATQQRDSLQEDIQQLRSMKRQAEVGWQEEKKRTAALDRELAFYQNASAKAMADRDSASFEAEDLRRRVASLEALLRSADGKVESEKFQKEDLAKQLVQVRKQLESTTAELRARIKEASEIPHLRHQLASEQSALHELTKAHATLQVSPAICWHWENS